MHAKRIVSIAPSNTEIVFALGEGHKLVGVSECCDYPAEVKKIERVGGFSTVNLEKIEALSPDIVLATDYHLKRAVPKLQARGVPTFVVKAETILNSPQAIFSVGEVLGCREQASSMAEVLEKRINDICQRTKALDSRPKVCYVCSHDPLCVALKSCAVTKLIEIAGGHNILKNVDKASVDDLLEFIVKENPQVIVTSKGHRETTDLLSYINSNPHFKQTDAYRNNRIHQIDAQLVCRPGPRAVLGLETLARFFHPEIFGEAKCQSTT